MFVKTVISNNKTYYYLAESIYDKESRVSIQKTIRSISEEEALDFKNGGRKNLVKKTDLVKNVENPLEVEVEEMKNELRDLKQMLKSFNNCGFEVNGLVTKSEDVWKTLEEIKAEQQEKNEDNGKVDYTKNQADVLQELKNVLKARRTLGSDN